MALNKRLLSFGAAGGGPYSVHFLAVAGGGAGGRIGNNVNNAGGGGGGGLKTSFGSVSGGQSAVKSQLNFLADGATYTITIGAGGVNSGGFTGSNGNDSTIESGGSTLVSVTGGGRGGAQNNNKPGADGGSGGGGARFVTGSFGIHTGGAGIADEGHNGGSATNSNGGGGGGAGAAGTTNGGAGLACDIANSTNTANASVGERSGGSTFYSGGGKSRNGTRGIGGTKTTNNSAATANTGGGAATSDGGGQSPSGGNPNSGGSGVVILRMPTGNYTGVTTGSPNVYTEGSDTILVYKSSGTYVD